MVTDPVEIQYREFYDVPRLFVASYKGVQYLFDASFDDGIDEYPDHYEVYVLPKLSQADLDGTWLSLRERASERIGTIATGEVSFDESRRRFVDSSIFRRFARDDRNPFKRTGTG
jgi:hypothetical protein